MITLKQKIIKGTTWDLKKKELYISHIGGEKVILFLIKINSMLNRLREKDIARLIKTLISFL